MRDRTQDKRAKCRRQECRRGAVLLLATVFMISISHTYTHTHTHTHIHTHIYIYVYTHTKASEFNAVLFVQRNSKRKQKRHIQAQSCFKPLMQIEGHDQAVEKQQVVI